MLRILPVTIRGRHGGPNAFDIGAEGQEGLSLFRSETARLLPFASGQLDLGGIERSQAPLPLRFQAASHEPIVRIDGAIAALGALRFVARPFELVSPLRQRRVTVALELLRGMQRRLDARRHHGAGDVCCCRGLSGTASDVRALPDQDSA
jgi:hypothetical protein